MSKGQSAPDESELALFDVVSEGRDYSGLSVGRVVLGDGSRFVGCDFSGLRATSGSLGAGWRGAEYVECTFDRLRLRNVMPGASRFVSCSFKNVTIIDFMCHRAEFVGCVFSGRLKQAVFDARVTQPDPQLGNGRVRNEYVDNDFSEMTFEDVSFRGGVDLRRQRLPSGPDYVYIDDVERAVARVRSVVAGWPDNDERLNARITLDLLGEDYETGQRQQLLRRSELGRGPEVANRLADLFVWADAGRSHG